MSVQIRENYSSAIQLELIMNGQTFGLAKIGPDQIVMQEAVHLPAGDAEIVMHVDGCPHTWPVTLPYGAVHFDDVVEIRDR